MAKKTFARAESRKTRRPENPNRLDRAMIVPSPPIPALLLRTFFADAWAIGQACNRADLSWSPLSAATVGLWESRISAVHDLIEQLRRLMDVAGIQPIGGAAPTGPPDVVKEFENLRKCLGELRDHTPRDRTRWTQLSLIGERGLKALDRKIDPCGGLIAKETLQLAEPNTKPTAQVVDWSQLAQLADEVKGATGIGFRFIVQKQIRVPLVDLEHLLKWTSVDESWDKFRQRVQAHIDKAKLPYLIRRHDNKAEIIVGRRSPRETIALSTTPKQTSRKISRFRQKGGKTA